MRRRRVDGDLARQHDLLERAGADPLDAAGDRLDVVLGRRDAGDLEAPGGRRVEQRELAVAQRRDLCGHPLGELLGDVVGRGEPGHGQADLAVAARQRHLGHDERAGAEARPVRRRAAVGGEREAADRHEPGAGRTGVLAGDRAARQLPPGGGDGREAPGAVGLERSQRAERRHGGAAARGLLVTEPVLAGLARGEHDRARIDGGIEAHGQADEHLAALAACAPDGARTARGQLGALLEAQGERLAGAGETQRHLSPEPTRQPGCSLPPNGGCPRARRPRDARRHDPHPHRTPRGRCARRPERCSGHGRQERQARRDQAPARHGLEHPPERQRHRRQPRPHGHAVPRQHLHPRHELPRADHRGPVELRAPRPRDPGHRHLAGAAREAVKKNRRFGTVRVAYTTDAGERGTVVLAASKRGATLAGEPAIVSRTDAC